MAKEIERKFLVADTRFLEGLEGERILQGYVAKEPGAMTTRVRVRAERAYITLKGPHAGISRDEFEYRIPLADALEILNSHCDDRLIQKIRYLVDFEGQIFEVDVFEGRHSGLVIAELELSHERQRVTLPPWIGEEVTHDRRYGNFYLAEFGLTGMPLAGVRHSSGIATSSLPFGRRN
jgi:adenylate cyclase